MRLLIALGLLWGWMTPLRASTMAHAAAPTITAFYTLSRSSYDQWDGVPPAGVTRFPAGVSRIYYYSRP